MSSSRGRGHSGRKPFRGRANLNGRFASVLRRGYRIGDRVLRPAMVVVVDRVDDGTTTEAPATVATEPDEPA